MPHGQWGAGKQTIYYKRKYNGGGEAEEQKRDNKSVPHTFRPKIQRNTNECHCKECIAFATKGKEFI